MKKRVMSYSCKSILFFIFLSFPAFVFPQLSTWVNYTNMDVVTSIKSDGDFLWIATNGGLVKLNKPTGEKTYYNRAVGGLPDNHLRNLIKDKDGNLWVTTQYQGIGCLAGESCQVYNTRNSALHYDEYCLSAAIDPDGNKWFGTLYYLNKFDGTHWQSWTTPNSAIEIIWMINDMKFDKQGILWIGGQSPTWSFARFDGDKMEPFKERFGVVNSIEIDEKDDIWLATKNGLVKYDREEFTDYTQDNPELSGSTITCVRKDDAGNIWFTSGIFLIKYDGKQFIRYEAPLRDKDYDYLTCLEHDGDVVWIGTRKSGLMKFLNGSFNYMDINASPLSSNDVGFDLCLDNENNVWFGTGDDLVKIDRTGLWHSYFKNTEKDTKKRANYVACDPEGNLWVSLGKSDTCAVKIGKDRTEAFTGENSPLVAGTIRKFLFDKKGNTWIATSRGLYKYNDSGWTHYIRTNSPLASNDVTSLALDKQDNLWGAMANSYVEGKWIEGGLFKYDGTGWVIYSTENSGLPTNYVMCLAFDSKDNLWVHCRDEGNVLGVEWGGGLTFFDGKSWKSYNIVNSGIPSNSILDIAIDRDDNIWLATVGKVGITRFDGMEWKTYDVHNSGIAFDEVSKITFDYFRGVVWINHLMSGGLSVATLEGFDTGMKEISPDQSTGLFDLYPNPISVGSKICIRFNDGICPKRLEVYDLSGFKLYSQDLEEYSYPSLYVSLPDMHIFSAGCYLVKLETISGTCTKRLLVGE